MADKYKVIIRNCPDYDDVDLIRGIVREGMEELGIKPAGKVLLKPNIVFAHKRYSHHAYTHPNVMEALLDVLAARPEVQRVTIGERTSVYMPTRFNFLQAGYGRLRKKPKVRVSFFDEEPLVEVPFKRGVVHKSLPLPRSLIEADYKIYAPKLKHHVSTRLTCSLKLNIGICDSPQRLGCHDFRLEEKIADLYEIGHPDLVVADAVVVGQQNEIVPKPLSLGVIIMGTTGVAVDSVAARLIGFDPDEIRHLRIARSRGWAPVTDDEIEIISETPFEELKEKTRNFDRTYSDLMALDTPLRFHLGNFPEGDELCHGGCINMMKGSLAVFEAYRPGALKKARDTAIVIGEYEGDVDGQGHPILLIGDCTKVKGEIRGKTKHIKGCPVAIPMFAVPASYYCKMPTVYMDLDYFFKYPFCFVVAVVKKFINRVLLRFLR